MAGAGLGERPAVFKIKSFLSQMDLQSKGKMKFHYLHLRKLQPEPVQTDTPVPACT